MDRKWRELLGRYFFGTKETEEPLLTVGAFHRTPAAPHPDKNPPSIPL